MTNLNRNTSLNLLQELIQNNLNKRLDYMPESFNNEQQMVFETFQKRVFLERTIDECISFNRKLVWENNCDKIQLTTTAEELIDVFKLRSNVYKGLNYDDEFPDLIEGLNFDKFDKNSAIIYNKINDEITGTCRLIFDSDNKLPIEEKLSFDYIRQRHESIGEVSRLTVKHKKDGLNLEFKNLTKGIYLVLKNNPINASISVISKEHFKLYSKFGGFEIEKELDSYGNLNSPFVITSWDPSKISKFFKKAFLN